MSEPAQSGSLALEPLWRPSEAAVAAANMTKFRTQVARDWQIGLKDTDVSVGMCGLLKRDVLADVDIGFAYLPQFGGQGFATEAALATMDYGRNTLGLKRIVAITAPDNEASQNVLRKIGLRYEKTLQLPAYKTDSLLFTPAAD